MYNIVGLSENSKISKIEPDAKTRNRTTKKQATLFLQFAAGVLFLLDNYLKEEKYLYLEGIPEHNEAFKRKVVVMHTKHFLDKLTNILQKVSHKKTHISYSR